MFQWLIGARAMRAIEHGAAALGSIARSLDQLVRMEAQSRGVVLDPIVDISEEGLGSVLASSDEDSAEQEAEARRVEPQLPDLPYAVGKPKPSTLAEVESLWQMPR